MFHEADQLAPFDVGDWSVDPGSGRLNRNGEIRCLEPKTMAVLHYLARHSPRVVSKAELLGAVWNDVVVSDDAVWRCISQLRRLLRDDPKHPRYIETLPKRGYRLVARVIFRRGSRDRIARRVAWTAASVLLMTFFVLWWIARGNSEKGNETFSDAASRLGVQYAKLGELDRSLYWHRRATIALDSDESRTDNRINLADAYLLLGEVGPARKAVLEVLKEEPNHPIATLLLARLELSAGRVDEARSIVDEALLAVPASPMLNLAAAIRHVAGDVDAAREYLERSDAAGTLDVLARLRQAHLLKQAGDLQSSEVLLARIQLELDEDMTDGGWAPRLCRSAVHTIRGENRQALEWLEKAIEYGFVDYGWLLIDAMYDELREDRGFDRLIESLERKLARMRRSSAAALPT